MRNENSFYTISTSLSDYDTDVLQIILKMFNDEVSKRFFEKVFIERKYNVNVVAEFTCHEKWVNVTSNWVYKPNNSQHYIPHPLMYEYHDTGRLIDTKDASQIVNKLTLNVQRFDFKDSVVLERLKEYLFEKYKDVHFLEDENGFYYSPSEIISMIKESLNG